MSPLPPFIQNARISSTSTPSYFGDITKPEALAKINDQP